MHGKQRFQVARRHVCHHVQELSLRECSRVSDEAVAAVAAHGSLEALDVSAVPEVGPATIKALATACKCAAMPPSAATLSPRSVEFPHGNRHLDVCIRSLSGRGPAFHLSAAHWKP
jgi:hypothetical protein